MVGQVFIEQRGGGLAPRLDDDDSSRNMVIKHMGPTRWLQIRIGGRENKANWTTAFARALIRF